MNHEKALLVVSYGSSHAPAREKTTDLLEKELATAFPDRRLYRAWTSPFMLKRAKEQGLLVDSLPDALGRMQADGIRDLLVLPVFIICASEYRKVLEAFDLHRDPWPETVPLFAAGKNGFARVRIATPLLASNQDVRHLAGLLPGLAAGQVTDPAHTVLVYMGHGSAVDPAANRIYEKLEETLVRKGVKHVLIGTIDGAPGFDHVLEGLAKKQAGRVVLLPLLLAAGAHVIRDMEGDRPGSWKSRIAAEGYEVEAIPRGLGEYEAIRRIFVDHAKAAARL